VLPWTCDALRDLPWRTRGPVGDGGWCTSCRPCASTSPSVWRRRLDCCGRGAPHRWCHRSPEAAVAAWTMCSPPPSMMRRDAGARSPTRRRTYWRSEGTRRAAHADGGGEGGYDIRAGGSEQHADSPPSPPPLLLTHGTHPRDVGRCVGRWCRRPCHGAGPTIGRFLSSRHVARQRFIPSLWVLTLPCGRRGTGTALGCGWTGGRH